MHTTSTTLRAILVLALAATSLGAATGCGGDDSKAVTAKKAGGKKGSAAASSKQKSGSTATSNRSAGADQGADSDGVTCDASLEGVGWCASDAEILFCAEGSWWLLDCSGVESGGFCGYDEDADAVDCYVAE